jgi:hypothetical protein
MMSLEDKILEALAKYERARACAYGQTSPGTLNNLLEFWRDINRIMKEHFGNE